MKLMKKIVKELKKALTNTKVNIKEAKKGADLVDGNGSKEVTNLLFKGPKKKI